MVGRVRHSKRCFSICEGLAGTVVVVGWGLGPGSPTENHLLEGSTRVGGQDGVVVTPGVKSLCHSHVTLAVACSLCASVSPPVRWGSGQNLRHRAAGKMKGTACTRSLGVSSERVQEMDQLRRWNSRNSSLDPARSTHWLCDLGQVTALSEPHFHHL